jgi:hypothetical protein
VCQNGVSCLNAPDSCRRVVLPVGACAPFINGQYAVVAVTPNDICVNATQFADSQCTNAIGGLSAACTSCASQVVGGSSSSIKPLTYDCGGLLGMMFTLSNCSDQSCDSCATSRVPYKTCYKLSGVSGFTWINGEAMCSKVVVSIYSDSGCQAQQFSSEYRDGHCFGNTKFSVN